MSVQPLSNRKRPRFQKNQDPFMSAVKEKAAIIIRDQKQSALRLSWIKTISYPGLYVLAYALLLWKGDNPVYFFACYGVMGLLTTLIVFNVVHDAVHHALFPRPEANERASILLDFLGGNSFVWGKRHVVFHHGFTNIPGWDIDIQQTGIVRFNEAQQYKKAYRYQILYMPFIYLLYSLNWILRRDFTDFFQSKSVIRMNFKIPRVEWIKLFAFKIFYAIYLVVVPATILHHSAGAFVLGILLMHSLMSALTLLVLLPSHLDEHANFPEPDHQLQMNDSWAVHQLKVTNDFGTDSPVLNFIMGGLNHHIAHHLFPHVNHNIIPKITTHIEATAKEQKLPYKCYSLARVMTSHFRLLQRNGHDVLDE